MSTLDQVADRPSSDAARLHVDGRISITSHGDRMNLALPCVTVVLGWTFGVVPYLLLQSIAMTIAGATGFWLFYVQHQFEDAYWERSENWDFTAAALRGSSYVSTQMS